MGRKWKRNKKNKHTGEGKQREEEDSSKPADPTKYGQERDPWSLTEGGNFKMEAFYAYQGIHDFYLDEESGTFLPCTTDEQKEEERQRWVTSLKSSLPASFRIGSDVDEGLRDRLEKELDEFVGKKMEIVVEPKGGERLIKKLNLKAETKMIAPARKIPYIPHAYQLSLDRQTIRRNSNLNKFHEWLKVQTEAGFVTRQETVSMIPPIVLDPKPNHIILDMCAAPGSKTSQLLEIVNVPVNPKDTEPTGCVIANDADSKRAYMLVHQMRRINSPAIFITCCDAQFFPLMRSKENPTEGIFDRVLCDVPCSGDGTSRKNPGVWKRWNQLNALGLHVLQLAIALKGARLTRVGGCLCYSTCSMNPIENESVVAELLRASEGSLELVDCRSKHQGLVARPGMSTWKVLSEGKSRKEVKDKLKKNNEKMKARRKEWEVKNLSGDSVELKTTDSSPVIDETNEVDKEQNAKEGPERVPITTPFEPTSMDIEELKKMVALTGMKEYRSFEEVPVILRRRIRATCFPPTQEEAARFYLERCMRVMPHDMDTGGFFVAYLKKVAPMNAHARERFETLQRELQENEDSIADDTQPKVKRPRLGERESADGELSAANGEEQPKDKADEITQNDVTVDVATVDVKADEEASPDVRGNVKKHYLEDKDGKKHDILGKDDFVPVPENIFEPLKKYYGLSSESFNEGNYMIRACSDAKVLYFLTKTVKSLIDQGIQQRVTVVTSGLKAFIRNNKDCDVRYRIAQEAVHFVAPHMTKRKIGANLDDFRKCLDAATVHLKSFSSEFAEQVRQLKLGSFVVYLKGYENDYIKKLVLVMWRCRGDAINTLVTQVELDGMKSKMRSILGEENTAGPTESGGTEMNS